MSTTAIRSSSINLPHQHNQSSKHLTEYQTRDSAYVPEEFEESQLASPPASDNEDKTQNEGVTKRPENEYKLNRGFSDIAYSHRLRDPWKGASKGVNVFQNSDDAHTVVTGISKVGGQAIDTAATLVENNAGIDNEDIGELKVAKLSPEKLQSLVQDQDSLPVRLVTPSTLSPTPETVIRHDTISKNLESQWKARKDAEEFISAPEADFTKLASKLKNENRKVRNLTVQTNLRSNEEALGSASRPSQPQRALSTPASIKSPFPSRKDDRARSGSTTIEDVSKNDLSKTKPLPNLPRPLSSPMAQSIPLPPLSFPTYLQLELSSQRPSQLYISRSANSEFPYESSRVKIERLLNFLVLPFHLEGVLWFGTLACIDAWLYTFTILPLRLLKSFYILGQSLINKLLQEAQFLSNFVYNGAGRMWRRRRRDTKGGLLSERKLSDANVLDGKDATERPTRRMPRILKQHRRSRSVPSALLPDDKADILKGLLIICTCLILLRFDASRMYHWIRGQAAIKLYVIYNILEVCDRLFSAIGQDVLECLFSREALERKPDGHSKVLRPFWLFLVALAYTVIHSTALFYQVITLNVAVNSYSNALITLLMSNQFVEIKSTVFKKFEKENLFQLTCADIVERFQLWHMFIIIASRNIVETGGLSKGFSILLPSPSAPPTSNTTNSSMPLTQSFPPRSMSSILPLSFTLVPDIVASITSYVPRLSYVLGPFMVVLGSEMLVDWLKHAYINKFNNTRSAIYGRFLDVLAKDYYTNAFADQNLTKRLGLPVIPLSCLLIRASVQTYQMFMAAWVPSATSSSSTSLTSIHEHYTASRASLPTSTSAKIMVSLDQILQGIPSAIAGSNFSSYFTTALICLLGFFVLLACKLVLGMLLLSFARSRYRSMKEREKTSMNPVEGSRRVGGWGVVEVDDDKRKWIYEDDPAGLRALREREERVRTKREKESNSGIGIESFDKVTRYEMFAKRIW